VLNVTAAIRIFPANTCHSELVEECPIINIMLNSVFEEPTYFKLNLPSRQLLYYILALFYYRYNSIKKAPSN